MRISQPLLVFVGCLDSLIELGMKKIRMFILIVFSLFCAVSIFAQKKEISIAKEQVKAGSNLAQAQASMEKLLKDSANHRNRKIWNVLYESVRKQYEQGNEKLYLKQAYDTASLFNLTRQLFCVAQMLDSVEMIPNAKGKCHFEFRKQHADYLEKIRPNLYTGGLWFIRKQKFKDAYLQLDQYLHCANMPLFTQYSYQQSDKLMPTAAYWAVYCGYKLKDPKATFRHSYEALKDTTHYNYMLQYLAETYKLEKDTIRYVKSLKEGFAHAPMFPFFFPRLVEYYVERNELDSALVVVDKALSFAPENTTYLYTKSTILLNQGKNEESLAISEKLISRADSLPEIYYNAGIAYFNRAVLLDKQTQLSRKKHAEINELYRKALPYLEKYRELQPNEVSKWSLPLYTIYLNLNMGDKFDEIDKKIRKIKENDR